ncbi:MAG: Cof-type HAD-IIB family hydrolase [Chloroflexota bacterium]|nr:Cof-type HAD-IIB family hydrolase [Chloroflexota bacterium]
MRLIALDLDGTLLTGAHTVSDANAAAVREAVAAGVHIVLATSRWYLLAKRTARLLGITSPIICHNGAMIRSPIDDARLLELTLPPAAAIDIAALADAARYESMVTVEDVTYLLTRRPNIDAARLPPGMVLTERLSSHVASGAEAFLFFGQDAVDGMQRDLDGKHAGELNLASGYSETFPLYLNIVHAGADKGRALRLVCEHVGVPLAETMAIGDAAPDLEMMRVAGISMAMGNAPDEVKSQVDIVGPSNQDDGVAWAIREYALA